MARPLGAPGDRAHPASALRGPVLAMAGTSRGSSRGAGDQWAADPSSCASSGGDREGAALRGEREAALDGDCSARRPFRHGHSHPHGTGPLETRCPPRASAAVSSSRIRFSAPVARRHIVAVRGCPPSGPHRIPSGEAAPPNRLPGGARPHPAPAPTQPLRPQRRCGPVGAPLRQATRSVQARQPDSRSGGAPPRCRPRPPVAHLGASLQEPFRDLASQVRPRDHSWRIALRTGDSGRVGAPRP